MLTRRQIRRQLLPDLNPGGLRRWNFYRPLAVMLAILMAPAASWLGAGNRGRAFQASAQVVQLCTPSTPLGPGNCVIQNYPIGIANDLVHLEQDAVNGILAFHNLPTSEAHVIYDYGRMDLRDEVRGAMYVMLEGIIKMPAAKRMPYQQNLYDWIQGIIYNNEIIYYQKAIGQYNSFLSDPCHFTLDPDIAKAYKLDYDGTQFCVGGLLSSIFAAPVPDASYFKAYGMKFSYTAQAQVDPNYSAMFVDSVISAGVIWGVAVGLAGSIATVTGALISNILAGIEATGGFAVDTGLLLSSATAATTAGTAIAAAGPAVIIFADVLVGIVAALEVVNDQEQRDELNALSSLLALATANTKPDLEAFLKYDANGAYKLANSFYTNTSPDAPSTAALPLHQPNDLSFVLTPKSGIPQVTDTLQYQDWNSNVWTVQTAGGWFVRTCSGTSCTVPDSIAGTLRYVDSSGTPRSAVRAGSTFIVVKGAVTSTDIACPADPVLGVSTGNVSQCASYVSNTLSMKDSSGNPITVGLTTFAAPTFNDPGPLTYSVGTMATKTITANGNPAPTIQWLAGTDASFNFNLTTGPSFPLTFDGSLTAPTGSFTLKLVAGNSLGSVTKNFTVNVQDVLQVVSPSTLSGTAGRPFSFTVVATGNPTPALTLDPTGYDLSGLTFTDHHDGTGTLSGTYTGAFLQQICGTDSICGGFIASNSQGSAKQTFELDMAYSPAAVLALPTQANFHAGVANSVLLTSSGAQTPVSWNFQPDPNAPWLTLTDNKDGTATLSGTPPAFIGGNFSPALSPYALGSGVRTTAAFPVNVSEAPVIVSPNVANFFVGSRSSFDILDNVQGTFTANNSLPNGLSLIHGSTLQCPMCLSFIGGAPAAGTGGQYNVVLTDTALTGSTSQNLLLNVFDVPGFSSPNIVTLWAGQPASFDVNMTGFPTIGTHSVAPTFGPPTSPTDGTGPYFAVSGLPGSLRANNFNGAEIRTGTLTIAGTPGTADVGTHKVQITAQNGVGSPAQQTLTVQVLAYNPTAAINLLSTWSLSRDANNNVIATVVIPNNGSQAAQNVSITSAKIGSVAGTVAPSQIASIPAESSATFRILFPAASVGAPGSANVLTLSGAYAGGSFNNAGRIVLP
jgi:hypothetical protein